MLKLKQSDRENLTTLLNTELGKAVLSSFKELVLREEVEPLNATDGILYSILMARKQAELDTIKYFIKLGEYNGK